MNPVALKRDHVTFRKAMIFSIIVHLTLFLVILLSPYFPKPARKGMVHYVNVVSFPGGGGGSPGEGGGEEEFVETVIPERETLRDLTTPQKLEQEKPPTLRHPVEKPKKKTTPERRKKTVIQKRDKTSKKNLQETTKSKGRGSGSGLRIGVGSGTGAGSGFQSPYSSQIGLSSFPFTYYLQIIINRVSSNWFTSLVDPGIRGNFQATVYFKIYKSGQISDLKIEESSGIRSLDLSALRAIQSSAPFPPLPRDYKEEHLGIHLIFEHTK